MYEYTAVVKSVYDGDTVTLDIDLGCFTWLKNEKCRLLRIDTPELRGSDEEKAKGRAARDWLRELILGKEVVIKTQLDKTGKYGRLLVDIYVKNESSLTHTLDNVNTMLVSAGHAVYRSY